MIATVFFQYDKNGWRVTHIAPRFSMLNFGVAFRNNFIGKELAITGDFPPGVRKGQFCKRPHKLMTVREFRK